MKERKNGFNSEELSRAIADGMSEKKGRDIVILDLRGIQNAITDFFVICTGNSDTQIDAIADSVEETVLRQTKEGAWHKEGFQNREWVLIDYVNVVASIFKENTREFYALEELWGDAKTIEVLSEQ
ncbi:ribosome silencing factor [Bacteroidota bacterium]